MDKAHTQTGQLILHCLKDRRVPLSGYRIPGPFREHIATSQTTIETAINTIQELHSLFKEPLRQVLTYIDVVKRFLTPALPGILSQAWTIPP